MEVEVDKRTSPWVKDVFRSSRFKNELGFYTIGIWKIAEEEKKQEKNFVGNFDGLKKMLKQNKKKKHEKNLTKDCNTKN